MSSCSKLLNPPRGEGGASSNQELLGSELLKNICDRYGNPRLAAARDLMLGSVCQKNVPMITKAFELWRNYAEYGLVKGVHSETGEEIRVAIKCSKRGNDVFSCRLKEKMGFLKGFGEINLFTLEDFDKAGYMPSNLLWVTLTFNPHLCSLKEAWEKIGYYWNLWITNMRNKYGKISYLETPEAFPNPEGSAHGYPHIHVALLFEEHTFNAFPSWEKMKDGSEGWSYRILERNEIKKQGKWMAFVDIKAIQSGKALGGYLMKHMKNTHGGNDPAALTTQALLWLHRKKTYTMSRGFRQKFHDLINSKNNSKTLLHQKTLDGDVIPVWIWSFHGVCSYIELGVDPEIWVVELDKKTFRDLKKIA